MLHNVENVAINVRNKCVTVIWKLRNKLGGRGR